MSIQKLLKRKAEAELLLRHISTISNIVQRPVQVLLVLFSDMVIVTLSMYQKTHFTILKCLNYLKVWKLNIQLT